MKRNQLMTAFTLSIFLTGVGISNQAAAQSTPAEIIAQRVCNPPAFSQVRRTEFRGINLSRKQQQRIEEAYNKFARQVYNHYSSGKTKCYNAETETIDKDFATFYVNYEATVQKTLTPRQIKQWGKNRESILGIGHNN